jgi:hypothetical protein
MAYYYNYVALDTRGVFMKQVTRNIEPDGVRDLLERVLRACIAFATDHGPQAQPIVFAWRDRRYLVGVSDAAECRPSAGQEVVLLIDKGVHYFELRALYVRGRMEATETPPGALTRRAWFEVVPIKMVAWDYGMLREVRDEG